VDAACGLGLVVADELAGGVFVGRVVGQCRGEVDGGSLGVGGVQVLGELLGGGDRGLAGVFAQGGEPIKVDVVFEAVEQGPSAVAVQVVDSNLLLAVSRSSGPTSALRQAPLAAVNTMLAAATIIDTPTN
jgi:hypothetical protein